jgi:hypothetical protein
MRVLFIVGLSLVFAVPTALSTTRADFIVGVNVSLRPNTVTLSQKQVRRGYYVEFKVRNTTAARRVFSLAGRTIAVPPRKFRYLAISFDVRGKYHYVTRGPSGDAIRGTFVVS